MKLPVYKFIILFTFMCMISAYSEINVEGRWVSTRIDNADDDGIGKGWVVVFKPDGTFSEEIDEGFGIVEEWEGTYSLKDGILSMQRSTFNHAWNFRIRKDEESLVIARMWKDDAKYTAFLKQSEEAHPELSTLPRWPKSKEDAVSILKQKLSEEDLNKLERGQSLNSDISS